jgi:hypothetical protein
MSVLDKRIKQLTEQIDELKKLQIIEEWFVENCGELQSINNFHSSYVASVVLSPINGMTDAIDNAMTLNPLQMYKVKDGSFTSFKPEDLLGSNDHNELIHPVICDVNHHDKNPKIKFIINSPFGLIAVQREVTGTDIRIEYEAYGRPLKYRRVSVVNYSYWFNSSIKYASGSQYAINPFTLYNKIEEKL